MFCYCCFNCFSFYSLFKHQKLCFDQWTTNIIIPFFSSDFEGKLFRFWSLSTSLFALITKLRKVLSKHYSNKSFHTLKKLYLKNSVQSLSKKSSLQVLNRKAHLMRSYSMYIWLFIARLTNKSALKYHRWSIKSEQKMKSSLIFILLSFVHAGLSAQVFLKVGFILDEGRVEQNDQLYTSLDYLKRKHSSSLIDFRFVITDSNPDQFLSNCRSSSTENSKHKFNIFV